jgi:hypothetical protein
VLAAGAAAISVVSARASERLADVNVSSPVLRVNEAGEALITYRRSDGSPRRVLVWGAINARQPDPAVPQVRFRLDYAGGWGKYRRSYWKRFPNLCRRYDGPPLVHLVAACKASDGSYWALQSWQRLQPMRGFSPFRPEHSAYELHVSHWMGALAVLDISPNWTYGGAFQGLFGRLTYGDAPVYGFKTPTARRADPYARHVYIDTYNSRYGAGWKRDTAIVTHVRNGAFCYSFVPQKPPPGYPSDDPRGPGNGERHRVTVAGPGVTPIVQWEGPGLGVYDHRRDELFNRLFDRLLRDDRVCTRER